MDTKKMVNNHEDDTSNGSFGLVLAAVTREESDGREGSGFDVDSADAKDDEQPTSLFSLPMLDDEELARLTEKAKSDREWLRTAGESLFSGIDHLERTEHLKEEYTEIMESRARAQKEINRIKEEARQRGIDWKRVEDSAFIARINACPIPDTKKLETTKHAILEMERIVGCLTGHPHHRKEFDGEPEVPLYRFANWGDRDKIKQWHNERKKLPVGYRFYAGRHMVPNLDPITGEKTGYQKAVEIVFGKLLSKYDPAIKAVYRQEVEDLASGKTEDLKSILEKVPSENYLVKSRNGLGAIHVRGFYKEFKDRGSDKNRDVFVVSVVSAVGIWSILERVKGFYIPIWHAKGGCIPKNTPKVKKPDVERFAKIMKSALKDVV